MITKDRGRHRVHLFQRYGPGTDYYVRVRIEGRRYCQSTRRNTRDEARARAAEMIREWKRGRDVPKARSEFARIGAALDMFEQWAPLRYKTPRTARDNVNALRIVVRRGLDQEEMTSERIAELSTARLTGGLVSDFETWMLARAGKDLVARGKAAASVDHYLRQARSVFGRRPLALYKEKGLVLPDLNGFLTHPIGAAPEDEPQPPSNAEIAALVAAAPALRESNHGAYMAWLIAVFTGMRPATLARLRWEYLGQGEAGDWRFRVPAVCMKANRSLVMPVADQLLQELEVWRKVSAEPVFVLPGLDPETSERRCQAVFRAVYAWMESLGWRHPQKLYAMRDWFAAEAQRRHGEQWASVLMGHAQQSMVARRYAGPLDPGGKIIELPAPSHGTA